MTSVDIYCHRQHKGQWQQEADEPTVSLSRYLVEDSFKKLFRDGRTNAVVAWALVRIHGRVRRKRLRS